MVYLRLGHRRFLFIVTVAAVIALRPFFGAFKAPKAAEKDSTNRPSPCSLVLSC